MDKIEHKGKCVLLWRTEVGLVTLVWKMPIGVFDDALKRYGRELFEVDYE